MTNGETRKDFETLGEAASRLLAGLVRRAKRPAGESPAEIAESGCVHVPEKKPEERAQGGMAQHPRAAFVTSLGGDCGDETEIADRGGRPVFIEEVSSVGYSNDNGLPDREDIVPTDRDFRRSRFD